MEQKPSHLGPEYAAQFEDESVARAYFARPPYAPGVFDVLEQLLPEGPRILLDLGCGTGDLSIPMAERVERVDAVDSSPAMLAVARSCPGANHPSLHWFRASAEEFEMRGPYSLVVAGQSLHWMDWQVVPARIAGALHPDGFLALVSGRFFQDVPWSKALAELIPRFTTNREYRDYNLVDELVRRGLFAEVGRQSVHLPHSQSVDDYVESFHSRNGLSLDRMSPEHASEFDAALQELARPHCPDQVVEGVTRTTIVWGRPAPADPGT